MLWRLLLLPLAGASAANVLVTYSSSTGHTKALAEAIGDGARKEGAHVKVMPFAAVDVERDVLLWADGFILGSPVHYGNPAADLLGWFEKSWESFWEDPRLDGKRGAAFATGGGLEQGLEHVITTLHRVLHSFRFEVVTPSPTRSGYNSYGAIAVTGTPPYFNASVGTIPYEFIDAGMDLGAVVARRCSSRVGVRTGAR